MAWLHTWVGLLVGWVLFAIFITGSTSYYRAAITDWMQPERLIAEQRQHAARPADLPSSAQASSAQASAAERAVARLAKIAPGATRWLIDLPDARNTVGRIAWQTPGKRRFNSEPIGGHDDVKPRETQGGNFLFAFHYQLHYLPPLVGRWIISFCAMFMLVAIVSGIVTHRRIFVDFFTFRPRKGQRSWLDAHNVSAVLALPYHVMITYTGLITLVSMLMPWGIATRYPEPNGNAHFIAEAYDFKPAAPGLGQPASLTAVVPLLDAANAQFGGRTARRIWIDNPGDVSARIKITRGNDDRLSVASESITFDGVTGKVVATNLHPGPAAVTAGTMFGLHEAVFAPPVLRIFFFLSGLTGALMVATGLVMWANKHRRKALDHGGAAARIGFGTRLVDHLNIATIAGLPLSVAVYFWANRLVPTDIAARSNWEIGLFFGAWALAALHPLVRAGRRAWLEQLIVGAALFMLLPVVDWLAIGQWVMPVFDCVVVGLGALLLCAAAFVGRHRPKALRPPKTAPPKTAQPETARARTDTSGSVTSA